MSNYKTQFDLQTAAYALAQQTMGMDDHDTEKARLAAFDASGLDPVADYADFIRAHTNHVSTFKILKTQPTKGAIAANPALAPKPVPVVKPAAVAVSAAPTVKDSLTVAPAATAVAPAAPTPTPPAA